MTLELAKSRRMEALNNRDADRILVKPAGHHSQVNLPNIGTAADYLIDALGHGADVNQIAAETGWSRSVVTVNLYKVAKKSGVGIRRSKGILHLMLPCGSEHIYPRPKVVAASGTVRSMEAEAFIITPPGVE